MLSLIPLLLVSFAVCYVFAVLRLITAALDAPIGYEDADGFHFGMEIPVEAEASA